ncbi:MAG: hypothetical protein LAO30_20735, partial [Acidobacteriia bacterium]|nr:hypothetical protein [Terriglobia bacterium]
MWGWFGEDLGVPISVSAGITAFADSRGQHVYYGDPSQHIHEHLCPSENTYGICSGWVDTDLTATYGGPLAHPNTTLTAYNDGSIAPYNNDPGEHVYYAASNEHINLFLYANNTWTNSDISAQSNTIYPSVGITLASTP